ncbi:MAG: transposase [Pyrinomonadaceae bacterium]|nr:transposase [Pyrinomonadaceae bacterium]
MAKKKPKRTYHLRNSSDYNKALVQRGRLTLWVSQDVLAAWQNTARTGKRGKPSTYTDASTARPEYHSIFEHR